MAIKQGATGQFVIIVSCNNNIKIYRCLVRDNNGEIMVTETLSVQFEEHFGLPFGSHYIVCKIGQLQPASYNFTEVTVITHNTSLERGIIEKKKDFPGAIENHNFRLRFSIILNTSSSIKWN